MMAAPPSQAIASKSVREPRNLDHLGARRNIYSGSLVIRKVTDDKRRRCPPRPAYLRRCGKR